jgi:hypothetical protein
MSDFEFNESLIERYKVLLHPGDADLSAAEVVEMLSICLTLGKQGYTLTDDEQDWMPPFTPDAS